MVILITYTPICYTCLVQNQCWKGNILGIKNTGFQHALQGKKIKVSLHNKSNLNFMKVRLKTAQTQKLTFVSLHTYQKYTNEYIPKLKPFSVRWRASLSISKAALSRCVRLSELSTKAAICIEIHYSSSYITLPKKVGEPQVKCCTFSRKKVSLFALKIGLFHIMINDFRG